MIEDEKPRRFESCRTHNNKHGYRGIFWDGRRQLFSAYIWPMPGKRGRYLGRFSTAKDAALAYDEAAREIYGADARLNFPNPDERQTEPSRQEDGLCPKGHSVAEHGYIRPDGRGVNCRKCNAESQMRAYRRQKAAAQNAHPDPAQPSQERGRTG